MVRRKSVKQRVIGGVTAGLACVVWAAGALEAAATPPAVDDSDSMRGHVTTLSVIDVTEAPYLAAGDGVTNDRAAIQSALDAAEATSGGATVLLPAGKTFLSGSITVGSGVALEIDGTLKQSQDTAHYLPAPARGKLTSSGVQYDLTQFHNDPFVFTKETSGTTITGAGTIQMTADPGGEEATIYVIPIGVLNSDQFTVGDLDIEASNTYNVAAYGSTNGLIHDLNITSTDEFNTDGISVINSQHIRVTQNTISNHDDGMYAVTRIVDPRDYDPTSWWTQRVLQPTRHIEFDNNTVDASQAFMMRGTIHGVADLRTVATTDIYVHDNYLHGRNIDAVGCYATSERAPMTRYRFENNVYVDDVPGTTLGNCVLTDFDNDMGALGSATLLNGDFEDTGDAWWSPSGDAGAVEAGDAVLVPAARTASSQLDGFVGYIQNLGQPAEILQGLGLRPNGSFPAGMDLPPEFPNLGTYRLLADVVTSGDPVRLVAYDACSDVLLGQQPVTATTRTRVELTFSVTMTCGQVRVGVDSGEATQGWALIDNVRLDSGVIDDADIGAVTYTGTWSPYTNTPSLDVMGTRHVGRAASSTATIPFTGGRAWMIGSTGPSLGTFEVYVDGVLRDTVDPYTSSVVQAVVLFDTEVLPAGEHTVRIVQTGTKNPASSGINIGFDALLVDHGP